ncbi:MAG: hypothetical protein QM757_17405 [Paludibaculum sp.]
MAPEELGTNIRQVYVEIQVQHALALSRDGRNEQAVAVARKLGQPVAGLDFTRDGMAVFLENARIQYILGELEARAGHAEEARACRRRAVDRAGRGRRPGTGICGPRR